jgi:hypothetical protein
MNATVAFCDASADNELNQLSGLIVTLAPLLACAMTPLPSGKALLE